jgi:hypothetical protein
MTGGRCYTCRYEKRAANYFYCPLKGEPIPLTERLEINNCPNYKRMGTAVSTPPYPLREPKHHRGRGDERT